MTTWKCANCDGYSACVFDDAVSDGSLGSDAPDVCPWSYKDERSSAAWVETDNPGNPRTQEIDALLEVIKQKDAIIDNCRSSLEEYRQTTWDQLSQIGYLKQEADPELYQKLKDEQRMVKTLKLDLERAEDRLVAPLHRVKMLFGDLFPFMILMVIVSLGIGLLWGSCL